MREDVLLERRHKDGSSHRQSRFVETLSHVIVICRQSQLRLSIGANFVPLPHMRQISRENLARPPNRFAT